MTNLGPLGAGSTRLSTADPAAAVDAAAELEALGYSTLWLAGGQENNLPQVGHIVRGTSKIEVATGIQSVDVVPATSVAEAYEALGPRFVVGLGGAHRGRPFATMNAYLDALDSRVPESARILSALGPQMLALARDRAAGAYPYLVTPDYVRSAREILGPSRQLPVLLNIVAERDAAEARSVARAGSLGFLAPLYAGNLRRMGFTDDDITSLSDRLVDGVVVWGDFDTVVRRVREYRDAGADQIVVPVEGLPKQWLADLPEAL